MRNILAALLLVLTAAGARAQYNTDRLMITGRSALYYEDYVLSIQYFNQVLNAKPYLFEPWFFRAVAKFYLDDFTGAEADVSEAIKLNPYIDDLYELRGLTRIRQSRYADAISDYDVSLAINPRNQTIWFNRALCRVENEDYAQAQLDLDTIIAKWGRMGNAYTLKAEVFLMQKDTIAAVQWLDKSLGIDPYNAAAWSARGVIALTQERWEDADTCLGKAIRLKPKTVGNYINRALARYNLNNLRGAMADYDLALDIEPTNFLAHYNRGLLRMELGDDNRAIDDFDYVLSLEPGNVLALFNRGILRECTGDLRGAVSDYSTVIEQFPNFWTGLSYRAACYRKLGMTAKAEEDEFKVLKGQLDKRQGKERRWTEEETRQMRKRSEIDPDKYDQLVVADDNNVEHEYKNAYRGRVQNRSVDEIYRPMFHIAFTPYDNGLNSYRAYNEETERFNAERKSDDVYVDCGTRRLDEATSERYLALIGTLSDEIATAESRAAAQHAVFVRAVAYAETQDFEAAISDLTTYIQHNAASAMGYWQRAYCLTRQAEFNAAQGIDAKAMLRSAMSDLDKAIALDPSNAYLYYDRAYLNVANNDYGLAAADYTQAIALDADLAEAYFNRGLVSMHGDNWRDGIADLSKAGELGLYDAYSLIKRNSKTGGR